MYLKTILESDSLENKRIFSLPNGSFEKIILNDEIFAFEQVDYTKRREECFIESHRKYVDFQMIVSGIEQMEYIDIDKLTIDTEYDGEKDLIVYKLEEKTSKFLLQKADVAIFFPEDAHIGQAMYNEESLIHKAVVKVPINFLYGTFRF